MRYSGASLCWHLLRIGVALVITTLAGCGGGGGAGAGGGGAPVALGVGPAACVGGRADGYPCNGLRLRKNVTLAQLGADAASDLWGWVDSRNGNEYAIVGLVNGVAFVNVTAPDNPVVVGRMDSQTGTSPFRDIKVAQDHAYVVADNVGNHGVQVFDLTRLRGAPPNQEFIADTVYTDAGSALNIVIDEGSLYAYAVGGNTCGGGLHMIDISMPTNPMFAGCYGPSGYTIDAQCVVYNGPDVDHVGKEVCFNANEAHVAIVDVSSKGSPVTLADFAYPSIGNVQQNWLTEDHRYLLVADDQDEQRSGFRTRTPVFDVSDLDAPVYLYSHLAATNAIDHNLYVRGNRVYQANYQAGLRVLQFTNLATDTLMEVASFDTHPSSDHPAIDGAWGVYPFFPSGVIVVSDIQRGLFILSP
jgi:choice-of-anchor B domain-containing protein